MLSSIDQMRHAQIWNLLYEYAEIRDQLEDLFHSIHFPQQNIEMELEDLSEDFDDLQERLNRASNHLCLFRNPGSQEPEELPLDSFLRELPEEDFPLCPDTEEDLPFPWEDSPGLSEGR